MAQIKFEDLFELKVGLRKYQVDVHKFNEKRGDTPLVASGSANNGVKGFYDIDPLFRHVITIPKKGTACHALYQGIPVSGGVGVFFSEPKNPMTMQEMIYYALLIRQEKYKYSHNRAVSLPRIRGALIPKGTPDWVDDYNLPTTNTEPLEGEPLEIDTTTWGRFRYSDLFKVQRGKGPTLKAARETPGVVPYISASARNGGVATRTGLEATHPARSITIPATVGMPGAQYQPLPFIASGSVVVLVPRFELTPAIAMYLLTVMACDKRRYSFGAQMNIQNVENATINLPVTTDGLPDWDYMSRFISLITTQIEHEPRSYTVDKEGNVVRTTLKDFVQWMYRNRGGINI